MPTQKPQNPCFSSGPCPKRPGWDIKNFDLSLMGRSHRSGEGKKRLQYSIDLTRKVLNIPADYRIGIVPASDTGAFEMALWSILGARGVDVFSWESFSSGWEGDIIKELKIPGVNKYSADYGQLPDMTKANPENDQVFVWNGTTSGVKLANADWISDKRAGLTLCDATSAVFAMDIDWPKIDVLTYSWQKVLGGEAAHGMLVLSPKAVERLESYTPAWPMPKIFRLTKKGKLIEGIFKGETINTPSMLALEDYIDALEWIDKNGGLEFSLNRSAKNLEAIESWVEKTDWMDFLAQDKTIRSNTSVCLKITDSWFTAKTEDEQRDLIKTFCKTLASEKVAYDINAYRDAPPGLRVWAGATVETQDLQLLFPWLEYAWKKLKS